MAEQEEKPIRVVDRRMFTPEGELRPDFQPEEPPEPPRPSPTPPGETSAPLTNPQASAEETPEQEETRAAREPRTSFGSLVGWIATNAYSALGLLPAPAGRGHRDLATARQMIDWLAVLEHKTRGNLPFEESDFLSRALYELRLAFVEVSRGTGK